MQVIDFINSEKIAVEKICVVIKFTIVRRGVLQVLVTGGGVTNICY